MKTVRSYATLAWIALLCSLFVQWISPPGAAFQVQFTEERRLAHESLSRHDFSGAEDAWERAFGSATKLTAAHRALIRLEQSNHLAHFGNSELAIQLLYSAEAEVTPWPDSPSSELREVAVLLSQVYESASLSEKVEFYRSKVGQMDGWRRVSIGPGLTAGSDKSKLLEQLGPPTRQIDDKNLWNYQNDEGSELSAFLDPEGRMDSLVIFWPKPDTEFALLLDGRVVVDGTTSAALAKARLGEPSRKQDGGSTSDWIYQSLGLTLALRDSRVVAATID